MRVSEFAMAALMLAGGTANAAAREAPQPGGSRPGHGVVRNGTFISPMGEPFRMGPNAGGQAPDLAWFAQADKDHDGHLTLTELRLDAQRFFRTLDTNKDGEIDPDEITRYETDVAPESSVSDFFGGAFLGGGNMPDAGGPLGGATDEIDPNSVHKYRPPNVRRGAGRYSYLDIPEPVIAADRDFNRGVSAREFDEAAQQRFHLLDIDNKGYLTAESLQRLAR